MREVIIQSWCDECNAEGVQKIGEAIDIVWRNREFSLDLCEEHSAPFRVVDRMVLAYGHAVKKTKKRSVAPMDGVPLSHVDPEPDGTYVCPEDGYVAKNAQGLAAHRRWHGYRSEKAGS